jgi:hypothetical protein
MENRRSDEEEERRKQAAPLSFRLFGMDVRITGEEDNDGVPMEIKKSSSMPNLNTFPPLSPGEEVGKRYASDDGDLASPQEKRRRRKALERKRGDTSFLFRFDSSCIRSHDPWKEMLCQVQQ